MHDGDCLRNASIHVGGAGHIICLSALKVRDMTDVDPLRIAGAHRVGRNIPLMRTEREPADTVACRGTPVVPAHKDDQRGSVDRSGDHGPGNPDPSPAGICPAPVMEGSETPGCIVNPGPSPWLHPRPAAEPVRRPSWRHACGRPHLPIARHHKPGAMIVEVFHSDHVPRDITHGGDPVIPLVAACAPGVPLIRGGNILQVVRNRACPRDGGGLPRGNVECVLTRRHLGLPLANHNGGVP